MTAAIEKFVRIFATTVPAFLAREKPISRNAKPACMNITSTPATITHIVFTLETVSPSDGPSAANAAPGRARRASKASGPARRSLVDIGFLLRKSSGGTRPADRGQGTPAPYERGDRASLDRCRKSGGGHLSTRSR